MSESQADAPEQGTRRTGPIDRFVARHAMFEVTPEAAFGIIKREEEFARRATRWVW